MIITILQVSFVLLLIVIIILFVFKTRRTEGFPLPENYKELLHDYVRFYANLHEDDQKKFEERFEKFLISTRITGANAEVENLDKVLIGAAAIIPVFRINDWEFVNLREVLVYPGNFNLDYEQHGQDRNVMGMVGTGEMQNVMIINKWELRQSFINQNTARNTAIHEFVHLIDKMDGTLDGVPEILLERKYISQWQSLVKANINAIMQGRSDIDYYGATSPVEFFAVVSEYFFEKPELFRVNHQDLNEMLERVYRVKS